MTEVMVTDLRPGDILLFKGDEKEWISKAIMELTNSDVSHAALCYSKNELVDEVLDGAGIHQISDIPRNNRIYVRRYHDSVSIEPVVTAAKSYVVAETQYNKPALLFLALILLYKKFTPSGWKQKIMIEIFERVTSGMVELIDQLEYKGKHPMVCSQFVYQCYKDAKIPLERDYKLRSDGVDIVKGDVENPHRSDSEKRFIDLVQEFVSSEQTFMKSDKQLRSEPSGLSDKSDAELARLLVEGEMEDQMHLAVKSGVVADSELVAATLRLSDSLARYHGLSAPSGRNSLSVLAADQALFVTPEDLKSDFNRYLNDVGMSWIDRKTEKNPQTKS